MTPEIIMVLSILGIAVVLFITEWVAMDAVALIVMGGLAITGLVTPAEALSGFSSPAVVTVWAILILSGALAKTGVASTIGQWVLRLAGNSEVRLLIVIMLTAGLLSGLMNSIGVASLFLPVVVDIARRTHKSPSKLLIPLAYAALLGGLTTLIGTPPNILISDALRNANLSPFQMFDYTPIGLLLLAVGTAYMVLVGRHLLPTRDITHEISSPAAGDTKSLYDLHERMVFLQVPKNSPLDGKTLLESRLGSVLGLNVIAIMRGEQTQLAPDPNFYLLSGDRLLVEGRLDQLKELHNRTQLVINGEQLPIEKLTSEEIDLAEISLLPGAPIIGRTLREISFRVNYQVVVLAIRRGELIFRTNLEDLALDSDDILLVQGHRTQLTKLEAETDLQVAKPKALDLYGLDTRLMTAYIPQNSVLIGKTLVESRLGDAYGLSVLGIVHDGITQLMPDPQAILVEGDTLLIKGKESNMLMIEGLENLSFETLDLPHLSALETEETGLVEAVLSPHTTLVGKTLQTINFRAKYGLSVLAIWREGRAYRSNLRDMPLRFGDALLLYGSRQRMRMLGSESDFLVLSEDAQEMPRREKAPVVLLILALVLIPVIFGWVPIAIAAVLGVALVVITKSLTMEEAYRLIEWKAVFLIAGMLPLGIAMEESGAAQFLAENMLTLIGGFGPVAVMAGLFILAAVASQIMPNPAVAVLLAPIALNSATDLSISPYPLMMIVAISASSAFLSPVGHSANLLVMGPGGYRFSDYLKVGLPLTLLLLVVTILIMPYFWPL